jgi:hypothetical protein
MNFSKPYVVANFLEDEVKILGEYKTYAEADAAFDKFSDMYPYACIDIDDVRNLM